MPYRYSPRNIIQHYQNLISGFWNKLCESFRQSKTTFFLQFVNYALALYIFLIIAPSALTNATSTASSLIGSSVFYKVIIGFFLMFVLRVVSSFRHGLTDLFDANLSLSLIFLLVFLLIISLCRFFECKTENTVENETK